MLNMAKSWSFLDAFFGKYLNISLYGGMEISVNEYVIVPIWSILWISFASSLIICFTMAGYQWSIFILRYTKMQPFYAEDCMWISKPESSHVFLYFSDCSNWQPAKLRETEPIGNYRHCLFISSSKTELFTEF